MKLEDTESDVPITVVSPAVVITINVTRPMEPVHRAVTQATQGDSVKIPVAQHVVGRATLVTRPMEPVHRVVTQATQGDSVKIHVALHVVGRTTLVTRLMEPVHRDVTQATQGNFVSQVSNINDLSFRLLRALLGSTCHASQSHTILGWFDVSVELVASPFFDVVAPLRSGSAPSSSTISSICEDCFLSCLAMRPK